RESGRRRRDREEDPGEARDRQAGRRRRRQPAVAAGRLLIRVVGRRRGRTGRGWDAAPPRTRSSRSRPPAGSRYGGDGDLPGGGHDSGPSGAWYGGAGAPAGGPPDG